MNSFVNLNEQNIQATAIRTWVINYISNLLDISEQQVKLDKPFSRFGLDSASIAAMTGELSQWLGADIDPSIAYDHSTINKISEYLSQQLNMTPVGNLQQGAAGLSK
jgi:acyl carrier protein